MKDEDVQLIFERMKHITNIDMENYWLWETIKEKNPVIYASWNKEYQQAMEDVYLLLYEYRCYSKRSKEYQEKYFKLLNESFIQFIKRKTLPYIYYIKSRIRNI